MAKAPVKEENKAMVAANSALPAFLQGRDKQAKIGNVDQTDLIIPRVKLMQKISPELDQFEAAKAGRFWHTVMSVDMGPELSFVPIVVRKTFVLWAPRTDDRGILARASDGLHWDIPDLTFTVKPKKSPHDVTYKLGKTVHDRIDGNPALSEFGSSVPGDGNSQPAAALTYEILAYFPDFPELSPAIILNTRSQVKPARDLLTKIEGRPVDHYYGKILAGVVQQKGAEGDFYNFRYQLDGYVDEGTAQITEGLFKKFETLAYRASDESEEGDANSAGGGQHSTNPGAHSDSAF